MKLEIDLDLPDQILDADAGDRLRQALREDAVLRLYADQKVAPALAAQALGLTRIQFLELTRRRSIPFTFADAEGLEADLASIEKYRKRHRVDLE